MKLKNFIKQLERFEKQYGSEIKVVFKSPRVSLWGDELTFKLEDINDIYDVIEYDGGKAIIGNII